MRALLATLALVSSTPALADEASWARSMAPLRGDQLELRGGGGVSWTEVGKLNPAVIVGGRWGITDNLQLALPLVATASLDLEEDLMPRLALSAGLVGIGYGTEEGIIAVPMLEASAHWIGRKIALVGAVSQSAIVSSSTPAESPMFLGVTLGTAVNVADAVSLGISAHASAQIVDPTGRLDHNDRFGFGSLPGDAAAVVPTIRVAIDPELSIELWTLVDFVDADGVGVSRSGPVDAAAELSLTSTFGW